MCSDKRNNAAADLVKLLAETTEGWLDGRRIGVWTYETTQVLCTLFRPHHESAELECLVRRGKSHGLLRPSRWMDKRVNRVRY